MRPRSWTPEQLRRAVETSSSVRQVLAKLDLRPAGGNYEYIERYIGELGFSTLHFKGKGWRRGLRGISGPVRPLEQILQKGVHVGSHKLKKRLIAAGLKPAHCELCGWAMQSEDGRLPLELDHVNGDHTDNRLDNLRILCPNCHSLQPTHRGRNRKQTAEAYG